MKHVPQNDSLIVFELAEKRGDCRVKNCAVHVACKNVTAQYTSAPPRLGTCLDMVNYYTIPNQDYKATDS